jgi:hypothetical protein
VGYYAEEDGADGLVAWLVLLAFGVGVYERCAVWDYVCHAGVGEDAGEDEGGAAGLVGEVEDDGEYENDVTVG